MNEKNNFALVPRPPSEIEKAEPGAKRVLSGMVAETLALAKPVLTVLLGDSMMPGENGNGVFAELVEVLIRSDWEKRCSLRFVHFKREAELLTLTRTQSFDLVILYVSNVEWETGNPIVTKDFCKPVDVLRRIKTRYCKPIIAMQGQDLTNDFEGTGIIFIEQPMNVDQFKDLVKANLPTRLSANQTVKHEREE